MLINKAQALSAYRIPAAADRRLGAAAGLRESSLARKQPDSNQSPPANDGTNISFNPQAKVLAAAAERLRAQLDSDARAAAKAELQRVRDQGRGSGFDLDGDFPVNDPRVTFSSVPYAASLRNESAFKGVLLDLYA